MYVAPCASPQFNLHMRLPAYCGKCVVSPRRPQTGDLVLAQAQGLRPSPLRPCPDWAWVAWGVPPPPSVRLRASLVSLRRLHKGHVFPVHGGGHRAGAEAAELPAGVWWVRGRAAWALQWVGVAHLGRPQPGKGEGEGSVLGCLLSGLCSTAGQPGTRLKTRPGMSLPGAPGPPRGHDCRPCPY